MPAVTIHPTPDSSAPSGAFSLAFDARGLSGLAAAADPCGAQRLAPGSRLGIALKYRVGGGDWLDLCQNDPVLGKAPFLASKNLRFPDRSAWLRAETSARERFRAAGLTPGPPVRQG